MILFLIPEYAVLPWNEETAPPPVNEFHASLLLTGIAVLLLPLFLVSAVFKVSYIFLYYDHSYYIFNIRLKNMQFLSRSSSIRNLTAIYLV